MHLWRVVVTWRATSSAIHVMHCVTVIAPLASGGDSHVTSNAWHVMHGRCHGMQVGESHVPWHAGGGVTFVILTGGAQYN